VLPRLVIAVALVAACAGPPPPLAKPMLPPETPVAVAPALPPYRLVGIPRLPPLESRPRYESPEWRPLDEPISIRLPTRSDVRPGESLVTTAMVEGFERKPVVRVERRPDRGIDCRRVELRASQPDYLDPGAFSLEVRAYRPAYRTAAGSLRRRYESDRVSFYEGLTDGPTGGGDGVEQWSPRHQRWFDLEPARGVSCPSYVPVTIDGEGTIRIGDTWALYESMAACRAREASRPREWVSC
jgi:hypothetical protein